MPVNQSFEELQMHLREQINFLKASISNYFDNVKLGS
jgi:hypothetical protein